MYGSTSGSGPSSGRSGFGRNSSGGDETSVGFQGTGGSGAPAFDSAQFHRLCDNITSNVFALTKHGTFLCTFYTHFLTFLFTSWNGSCSLASTLDKTLKTIGSSQDSRAVRESVHVLQVGANRTIATTTEELRELNGMVQKRGARGGGQEERMRVTRLTSDFQSVVQRYTDLQKQIVAKMKTTLLRPESMTGSMTGSTTDTTEDPTQNLLAAEAQRQAQLQLQEELEFEQGMLLEREERIREIESDILDVNTIMKELGTLVHEQGETIGTYFTLTFLPYFLLMTSGLQCSVLTLFSCFHV